MLRVTEALLIGSYAAHLRGVLPAWRNGHVGDADFICTRPAAAQIMEAFGHQVVEHAPDRCFRIDRDGGLNIDIDLRGHLLPSIAAHADEMRLPLNGLTIACLVARPELIVALRAVSWSLVPKAMPKACRDMASYRLAGIISSTDLLSAAEVFRKPDDGNRAA